MFIELPENDLVAKATQLLVAKDPIFEAFLETYTQLSRENREILLNFSVDFLKSLSGKTEKANDEVD